jgi:hypothetical protein
MSASSTLAVVPRPQEVHAALTVQDFEPLQPFTAGDVEQVNAVLRRLAAMRSYMRDINLGREPREDIATCSLDYEGGPGMGGSGPFGETSGGTSPIAVENFRMLRDGLPRAVSAPASWVRQS